MARTTLTVTALNNGTSASLVELTALLAAANADGSAIANGTDRRTCLFIKNASGTTRTIDFTIPATLDGDAGDAVDFYDSVGLTAGFLRTTLATGSTGIYGPWRDNIFNQTDGTVYVDYDSVTSVTVAAFKLPYFRANASQGLHRTGAGATPATVDTLSVQKIIPEGLVPSFDDHDQANGWLAPLHRPNRRFIWIRNNSGGPVSIVPNGVLYSTPLSDSASATALWRWRSDSIADTEEWLLGPWDHRAWWYTASDEMWIRGNSGPHVGCDAAWLELSP